MSLLGSTAFFGRLYFSSKEKVHVPFGSTGRACPKNKTDAHLLVAEFQFNHDDQRGEGVQPQVEQDVRGVHGSLRAPGQPKHRPPEPPGDPAGDRQYYMSIREAKPPHSMAQKSHSISYTPEEKWFLEIAFQKFDDDVFMPGLH